jgi:hypothetical protein
MRGGRTADWLRAGVTDGELAALGVDRGPRLDLIAAFRFSALSTQPPPPPTPAQTPAPPPTPQSKQILSPRPKTPPPQLPTPPLTAGKVTVVKARGSQYSAGGISACTPMAVEACLQLLRVAAAGLGTSEETLGQALEAALKGVYTSQAHLAPNAVLGQPRYRAALREETNLLPLLCGGDQARAAAQQLPLAELNLLLSGFGKAVTAVKHGLSLMLVRPPETVSLTALPAGGGVDDITFILFDSHPRPPAEETATLHVFSDAVGAERYLQKMWKIGAGVLDSVDSAQVAPSS